MEQLTFKVQAFEGPLDLLEHLIKKNKLNICSVSLIAITEQYIAYLEQMQRMDLELSSDFLVVASNLLYIKSKELLPKHEPEDDATEIARNLTEALKQRRRMKLVAELFQKRQFEGMLAVYKGPEEIGLPPVKREIVQSSVDKLLDAFLLVLEKAERKAPPPVRNFEGIVGHEKVSVRQTANRLVKRLRQGRMRFEQAFAQVQSKSEAVALFLAILELMKLGQVHAADEGEALFLEIGTRKTEAEDVFDGA